MANNDDDLDDPDAGGSGSGITPAPDAPAAAGTDATPVPADNVIQLGAGSRSGHDGSGPADGGGDAPSGDGDGSGGDDDGDDDAAAASPPSPLTFPTAFPIKIMGKRVDGFADAIVALVREHAPDFDPRTVELRASSKGNYIGLTVTINATSRAQLDAIYQALTGHPLVSVVL